MDSKETVIAYRELYANDIKTLENAFYNIFPNAKIEFSIRSSVGSPILRINILLISDTKDQSSGCNDNDPLGIKFIGFLPEISSPNKATKFDLEKLSGGLSCNPEKGSYMAMNTLKLPFRKSTGDMANQSKKLVKFFKSVAQKVIENKDNLYKKDILPKYLEINL